MGNRNTVRIIGAQIFEWSRVPLYMTPADMCQLFGVTQATLINWEKQLGLPVVHMGGVVRYSKEGVRDWINAGCTLKESEKPGDELPGLRVV